MVSYRFLLFLILTMAFTACQVAPKEPEEQVIQTYTEATLVSQATYLPSNTPLPTDTPIQETPTLVPTTEAPPPPTPSPTSTFFFQDNFDQALEPGWFWVREEPAHWSLNARPGFLRLELGANDCNNPPNNVALQTPPSGNYELETMVEFSPQQNFQLAGLIIYQDDDNFLKLGRAYCDSASICIGNGIYFDFNQAGVFDKSNYATPANNQFSVFLKLRKMGSSYMGYQSEDGENWTTVGEHVSDMNPIGIGIYAGQSCAGSLPADFDFLSILQLP